jgi:hypothetical protein
LFFSLLILGSGTAAVGEVATDSPMRISFQSYANCFLAGQADHMSVDIWHARFANRGYGHLDVVNTPTRKPTAW